LALPGVRSALRESPAPVAAVSPLVAGKPVKGPADRLLHGLGVEVSVAGGAGLYRGFLDTFVIDAQDESQLDQRQRQGVRVMVTDTIMSDMDKSVALAQAIVAQPHTKRRIAS